MDNNQAIAKLMRPMWDGNPHYHAEWIDHCENEGTDPNDYEAAEDWLINLAEEAEQRRYEAYHQG